MDADFNFRDDFKSVEDGQKVLEVLSENLFFIGRKIYSFEEHQRLRKKDECLEDFIIYNIFEDKEYTLLTDIVTELWDEYFNLSMSWNAKGKNFAFIISKIRRVLRDNRDDILKKDNLKNQNIKIILRMIETKIKEKIKNMLLGDDIKYMKFEEEILKIISPNS